jgi:hypothetical protein
MFSDLLDWRSLYRAPGGYDYSLYIGTEEAPPRLDPPRYVLRWLCQQCEQFYLTASGAPAQPCPACGHLLARVGGTWDLREQRAPRWWRDTREEGPHDHDC